MDNIVKITTALPKSMIDEFRRTYKIPDVFTDERIYEAILGNLIDRYFDVEYFQPKDVQSLLTDNIDEMWL